MNYYERHIGDYLKDTSHLSLLEHGIYTRLLDVYYTREGPLQANEIARLIGARSKDEREALNAVLREFFVPDQEPPTEWLQRRCEHEIERFRDKQAKAKRSAQTRWDAQRAQSKGNANAMRTHSEGNAPRARPQTPDTSNTPLTPQGGAGQTEIPCPYSLLVDLYHEHLPSLPRVKLMPPSRQRAMRKVWGWLLSSTKADGQRRATTADEALQWLGGYFAQAAGNDFLMGRTPRGAEHANWRCDIDFLMTDKGMRHVIERTQDAA